MQRLITKCIFTMIWQQRSSRTRSSPANYTVSQNIKLDFDLIFENYDL